jgi:malonate-semialdehyde dehydrogenase (acetylating) / methylmalonate-semialdehyde dehydrogenase
MASTRITHWINGEAYRGDAERTGDVFDPALGSVTGQVDFASEAVVDDAVAAAARAFESWRSTSLSARTTILFKFRELLAAHKDELAAIITAEHGKVLADAAGEVQRGLEVAEFACGIPHLLKGGFSENVSTKVDSYSLRQPLGPVAIISPFNFPAMVPMWFFPIAIACGNTVILKPSEKDPSAANFVAKLWAEAGLPDGVFNVVHGDKVAVDALLTHPDVAAVSFVGSTPVARYVYETGTASGKRVQALGGAKNHMVVLPDADLDLAVEGALFSGFGTAGQRCTSLGVLLVHEQVHADFLDRFVRAVEGALVGLAYAAFVHVAQEIGQSARQAFAARVECLAQGGGIGRRYAVVGVVFVVVLVRRRRGFCARAARATNETWACLLIDLNKQLPDAVAVKNKL